MLRRISVLLLTALFLVSTPNLSGQEAKRFPVTVKEIDASLDNEWFGVYFQGKKIGYINSVRSKEGKGDKTFYRETQRMSLKLLSFGQKTELSNVQVLEFDGQAPFALRGAHSEVDSGKTKETTRLARTDKGYEHIHTIGTRAKTQRVDKLDFTLGDAMTSEIWMKKGLKVGDQLTTRGFRLEELDFTLSHHKVLAQKTSVVSGVKVEFFEIETQLTKPNTTVLARYDKDGHMISGVLAIFEIRRETEAQAKNTEFSQDIFVFGQVKLDKELGNATRASSVVIEVSGGDKDTLKSGPRQQVTVNDNGSLTIKLGKEHRQEIKATDQEIKDALKETRAYHINDPKIKELAGKAVGKATTPEQKVKNLVRFVHNFINPALTVHSPTIPDLLEHKEGDCKAYALMFVTLARAAGIPAREVSGLAYMGDDTKAFGGHAWNEVVLDGKWVPIDAAFNQFEVDAGHICFGTDDSLGNVLKSLGKLKFRLVEVKRN